MKFLQLLNDILEKLSTTQDPPSADIKEEEEEEPIVVAPLPEKPNTPLTLSTPQWQHLNNEQTYKLIVPPEAFDPHNDESALMCTIVKNEETGESRLIPYMNIPVLTRTIIEVHTTSALAEHKQEWEFDIEEH